MRVITGPNSDSVQGLALSLGDFAALGEKA